MSEENPVRVARLCENCGWVRIFRGTVSGVGVKRFIAGRDRRQGVLLPEHPAVLLKIYLYGYLNQVHSSRRLERETQRNIELMWLVGRLAPDVREETRCECPQTTEAV